MAWLGRERPDLVAGYRRVYGDGSYAHRAYRGWLTARVAPLVAKHGLDGDPADRAGVRWASKAAQTHPVAAEVQPSLF